jgi:hypothetical protein
MGLYFFGDIKIYIGYLFEDIYYQYSKQKTIQKIKVYDMKAAYLTINTGKRTRILCSVDVRSIYCWKRKKNPCLPKYESEETDVFEEKDSSTISIASEKVRNPDSLNLSQN